MVPEPAREKSRIMVVAMVNPARLVRVGDAFAHHRRRAMRSRRPAIGGVEPMSNPRVVAAVPAIARRASLVLAVRERARRVIARGVAHAHARRRVAGRGVRGPGRERFAERKEAPAPPGRVRLRARRGGPDAVRRVHARRGASRGRAPPRGPRERAQRPEDHARHVVEHALDNPAGQPPLREKIRCLVKAKKRPKILFAFDDVSIHFLAPHAVARHTSRDPRRRAERRCVEEGVDARDVKFVCSIALHRYIREEEFRHVCGAQVVPQVLRRGPDDQLERGRPRVQRGDRRDVGRGEGARGERVRGGGPDGLRQRQLRRHGRRGTNPTPPGPCTTRRWRTTTTRRR